MKKTHTMPYHPMRNGMVERFNRTQLNILGTLEGSQKVEWKSYVSTITHAYNAAGHDSKGISPFILMFGRHPRLVIDAFLGIPQDTETTRSHNNYVDRLKQRLNADYVWHLKSLRIMKTNRRDTMMLKSDTPTLKWEIVFWWSEMTVGETQIRRYLGTLSLCCHKKACP